MSNEKWYSKKVEAGDAVSDFLNEYSRIERLSIVPLNTNEVLVTFIGKETCYGCGQEKFKQFELSKSIFKLKEDTSC